VAYYAGMSAPFWLNWLVWTSLGAGFGSLMGDPARLGADFAFTALFIGLVAGFARGEGRHVAGGGERRISALVHALAGPPWHVAAGALAGILAAFLLARPEPHR
jgi:predicted branched-subunit amino acid permease